MDTLAQLIDRREPVQADCPCETVLERFIRDPSAHALAVVDASGPVGVIPRDSFLARMEVPGSGELSARSVMSAPPALIASDLTVEAAVSRLLLDAPEALLCGFVAVDAAGRYEGVGTALGLLKGRARVQASEARAGLPLALVAAEAREPVNAALAAVERLRRFRLPDDALACLDTVAEAGAGVLSLLGAAAELDEVAAGAPRFELEARRLQDLMDELEARWRGPAERAGVVLMVSYDGDPDCSAMVDAGRLMQVFDALIGHSLAHVRQGVIEASLKTLATEDGVQVRGRVRDNGALYDATHLQTMFDATARFESGAGLGVKLGLALAARTVGALGGALAAEANVGAGATVAFEVRLRPAQSSTAAAGAAEEDAPARSAHILVVDDNATNRMVVEALCEMFDCSTESVCDGVEAVEAVQQGRYDVILMDIKMPRMDGVTATREIRKLKGEAGRAPIIALTANADPDEVREYLAAGMQGVVEKPIKPERLLEALDAALALRMPETGSVSSAAA